MPATVGWHPWFRASSVGGEAIPMSGSGSTPGRCSSATPRACPSGERRRRRRRGPWDDAFTDVAAEPVLEWPGRAPPRRSASTLPVVGRLHGARARAVRRAAERAARRAQRGADVVEPAPRWSTRCAGGGPAPVAARRLCRVGRAGTTSGGSSSRIAPAGDVLDRARTSTRAIAPLRIGTGGDAESSPSSSREVRVVAHEARALRVPVRRRGSSDDDVDVQRPPPSRSSTTTRTSSAAATSSAVSRARSLGRGDEQVRRLVDAGEQPAQPLRLAPPLLGQRPQVVVARPALGVAGVGVAEQVEGDHAADHPSSARPSVRCRRDAPRSAGTGGSAARGRVRTARNAARRSLLRALGLGRVGVAPVHRLGDAREDRARAAGVVAHGDHVVEPLAEVVVDRLRARARRSGARPPRGRGSSAG